MFIVLEIENHPDRGIDDSYGPFDTHDEAKAFADDMFYVDWDEETDLFCVFAFDDMRPFAYSSWCSKEMAEEDAKCRNADYKIAQGLK